MTYIAVAKASVSFRKYLTYSGSGYGSFVSITAGDEVTIMKHTDKYLWF